MLVGRYRKHRRAEKPSQHPHRQQHEKFDQAGVDELKERYRKGTVGDVEVKQKLFNALEAFLRPIRERRAEFAAKPGRVREIIMEGTRKGRVVAQSTMDEVRAAMKLNYKLGG